MTTQDFERLEQARQILTETSETLKEVLKGIEPIGLTITSRMSLMVNMLNHTSGNRVELQQKSQRVPVTNFFGDEIKAPKKVATEDLSPKELEKKIFNEKVARLKAGLETMSNKQVIESYPAKDQVVIRGLARDAGIENFKKAEINEAFIDSIREGFKSIAETERLKAETEADLENQNQ